MMTLGKSTKSMRLRQGGAALLCLVLLYFAVATAFCTSTMARQTRSAMFCQSLHAPALTVTFSGIASAPQITGWHDSAAISLSLSRVFDSSRRGAHLPPSV
jgi:hypothetical protein